MTEISKWPLFFRKAAFFPPGILVKEIRIKCKDCPGQDETLNFQNSAEKKRYLWKHFARGKDNFVFCPTQVFTLRFLWDLSFWNNFKTVKIGISYLKVFTVTGHVEYILNYFEVQVFLKIPSIKSYTRNSTLQIPPSGQALVFLE